MHRSLVLGPDQKESAREAEAAVVGALQSQRFAGLAAGEQQRCCSWQGPASLPASSHHAPRQAHHSLEAVSAQLLRPSALAEQEAEV